MSNSNSPDKLSADRPKLLIVITKADIGGAQIHVLQILRGLGHLYNFILVSGEEDFLTHKARQIGVDVVICPSLVRSIRPLQDLRALISLGSLFKSHQPDLVHAHSFKAGMITRIAAIFSRTQTLFTAHGWAFTPGVAPLQRAFGLLIEFVLSRFSKRIIVVSMHDYELARRWRVVDESKLTFIANCAELPDINSRPHDSPVKLISVGRLARVQKNQQMLLEVMVLLPADVTLTIVGEGLQRSLLEKRIIELGLSHRVRLPGEVEDIRPFLQDSQVFVLSSDYEGLPLSVLEAICAGLPVVATDVGGVSEAVRHGESGYLVARGDVEAFVQKIILLINDPECREQMGAMGRQIYLKNYQPQQFLEKTESVYRQLLEG